MLVLSRKTNERIRIGDNIIITVVGTSPGQVRLGIEAPETVLVYREELYAAIQRTNLNGNCPGSGE